MTERITSVTDTIMQPQTQLAFIGTYNLGAYLLDLDTFVKIIGAATALVFFAIQGVTLYHKIWTLRREMALAREADAEAEEPPCA